MKQNLILIGLLLMGSCAAKYKLQSQTNERKKRVFTDNMDSKRHYVNTIYTSQTDSLYSRHWFKIYPKGEVQINSGNFIGKVDSLIWHTDEQSLQRHIFAQQNDTSIKEKRELKAVSVAIKEAQVKEKKKSALIGLPILFVAILGLLLYLLKRKAGFSFW